jgi:NAD-dependent deacetylase
MKKMVILTGAGMSAESGIQTFRDADGLWEGHPVMEVASPEGYAKNPELVLKFYNERRKQLLEVLPNKAHFNLVKLENKYHVDIITQNVDDLHERAGSSKVTHLHGELLKVRSSADDRIILDWKKELRLGDLCAKNSQLRPHIVWFGEFVPMLEKAAKKVQEADLVVIIGTSMQVYPAASLIDFASLNTPIYFIDPNPKVSRNNDPNLCIIKDVASSGTDALLHYLNA